MLKSIRRGEWSMQQILEYFEKKRLDLETARAKSRRPARTDEAGMRELLLHCLESQTARCRAASACPERRKTCFERSASRSRRRDIERAASACPERRKTCFERSASRSRR